MPWEWALGVAAEEMDFGKKGVVLNSNNHFGLHVSSASDNNHFNNQTGVYTTTGKPPGYVAKFSADSGFLDSGMAFLSVEANKISGISNLRQFADVLHVNGYGTTNPNYVSELLGDISKINIRENCPQRQ